MDIWPGINYDPITLHKYLYANADPGNLIDPSGNFSIGSTLSALNVAANLVTTAQTAITVFNIASGEEEFSARETGIAIVWSMIGSRANILTRPLQKFLRSSGCLRNSFAEDTLVRTDNGLIEIKDVSIGDLVLSYNEASGETEYKPVIHVITSDELKETLSIELSNGKIIKATPEHLLYIEEKWVATEDVEVDQKLRSLGDKVKVTSVSVSSTAVKVYNLTVKNNHNYFVGEDEILAHNISPCEKTTKAIAQSVPGACKQ